MIKEEIFWLIAILFMLICILLLFLSEDAFHDPEKLILLLPKGGIK